MQNPPLIRLGGMLTKSLYQYTLQGPDLQELYHYAWDTFYKDEPQTMKMFNLINKVMSKELSDGTYTPRRRDLANLSFGKQITDIV